MDKTIIYKIGKAKISYTIKENNLIACYYADKKLIRKKTIKLNPTILGFFEKPKLHPKYIEFAICN